MNTPIYKHINVLVSVNLNLKTDKRKTNDEIENSKNTL